ncbi:uncharacterized protein LOC131429802 [Malaya genurostris]|uniref:uncharacterized protein LOC131429802 n=1 Tax=Malaya genurostris TaxID=325434 RepID=UPI0026F394D6|nr:uncharacterized protein LOC131429802 [Malaya genurostris]
MNSTLNETVLSIGTVLKTSTDTELGMAIPDYDKSHSGNSESLRFIFIPLAVLITVMLLSIMVYLMARKKDKIFSKRSYVPSYSFDSSDLEDNEDLETEHLLKGKLLLDEPYFKGVNNCKMYSSNTELYT